jgi:hypothetical protein
MKDLHISAESSAYSSISRDAHTLVDDYIEDTIIERLPFTVRAVRNAEDLSKAVRIRHSAYARHVPDFAEKLVSPEATDEALGVVVLLAESKADGSPLGTMRIQTNQYGPLGVEKSLELPDWLRSHPLAEATRLGITLGHAGRLVKTALFKAFYEYCRQNGVKSMVVTGRIPIDRQYEQLMFKDVFSGKGYIPLLHVGNMPHRVMALDVEAVEPLWSASNHPLYKFFFLTQHPDINVATDDQFQNDVTSNPLAPAPKFANML